jgi:hypothetical protein
MQEVRCVAYNWNPSYLGDRDGKIMVQGLPSQKKTMKTYLKNN